MNVSFKDDPTFQEAVTAGIRAVMTSPEFIRAVAAEMGPQVVWLTAEQVRGVTQQAPSTFARWLKKYRNKLVVSPACGRKAPRYRFDSVQNVMLHGVNAVVPKEAAGSLVHFPAVRTSAQR